MDNQILLHADHQNSEKSLIIYKSKDDEVQLDVKVMNETVWLTQAQMALFFGTQRQAITKHLKTIFDCHELERTSNSSIWNYFKKSGKRRFCNFQLNEFQCKSPTSTPLTIQWLKLPPSSCPCEMATVIV